MSISTIWLEKTFQTHSSFCVTPSISISSIWKHFNIWNSPAVHRGRSLPMGWSCWPKYIKYINPKWPSLRTCMCVTEGKLGNIYGCASSANDAQFHWSLIPTKDNGYWKIELGSYSQVLTWVGKEKWFSICKKRTNILGNKGEIAEILITVRLNDCL